MARVAGGKEALVKAKELLAKAKTADELRHAQAVVLPLEFGYTLEHTARIIGVSAGYAGRLRAAFIRHGGVKKLKPHGGRRRENMTKKEEADFLAPFFEKAATGGILVVGEIKQALDERLGRHTALASAYNLLHRHGWRKLAPDRRHPKADIMAQEAWKKNSPNSSPESRKSGRKKSH
jgi:transposase